MKILLTIFAILMLSGCYASLIPMPSTDVFLDPTHIWANASNNSSPSFRKITLRAINYKYRDVDIKVRCEWDDVAMFNEVVVLVPARSYKVFTVPGFSRGVKEVVSCYIKSVR